jgi:hypothetical protein
MAVSYVSYIMAVSYIGGGRHWQTLPRNVLSSTPRDNTDKISIGLKSTNKSQLYIFVGGERGEYSWIEPSAVRIVAVRSSMCKSWNVMEKDF